MTIYCRYLKTRIDTFHVFDFLPHAAHPHLSLDVAGIYFAQWKKNSL